MIQGQWCSDVTGGWEQSSQALLACVQDDPGNGGAQGHLWEMTPDLRPQTRLGQEARSEGREERVKADGCWGHGGAPPETESWEFSVRGELLEDLTGHPGGAGGRDWLGATHLSTGLPEARTEGGNQPDRILRKTPPGKGMRAAGRPLGGEQGAGSRAADKTWCHLHLISRYTLF